VGATTASTGAFTTLAYTGTLTGGTGVINIGSGQLYKDASGNVGVGTSAPNFNFEIAGTGSQFLALTRTDPTIPGSLVLIGGSGINVVRSVGAKPLTFDVDSTERMRIDSAGNVGIGTSSPGSKLDVAGFVRLTGNTAGTSNTVGNIDVFNTNSSAIIASFNIRTDGATNSGSIRFNTANAGTNAERMRITAAGNVGIGTSSPGTRLHVIPTTGNVVARFEGATSGQSAYLFAGAGSQGISNSDGTYGWFVDITGTNVKAATNNIERMRIDSSGNLLVGTTSAIGARLRVVGSSSDSSIGAFSAVNTNTTASHAAASFVTGTNSTATSNVLIKFGIDDYAQGQGQINANGASQAAFGSFSDRRLKENIQALPSQLDNIMALRPVEFDYIESEGGGHQIGFIAQEMQKVYPDAVGERGDGMLTVTGWDKTTARLVAAIQEQQAIINDLKARLDAANL
jgi:hypothetical protein